MNYVPSITASVLFSAMWRGSGHPNSGTLVLKKSYPSVTTVITIWGGVHVHFPSRATAIYHNSDPCCSPGSIGQGGSASSEIWGRGKLYLNRFRCVLVVTVWDQTHQGHGSTVIKGDLATWGKIRILLKIGNVSKNSPLPSQHSRPSWSIQATSGQRSQTGQEDQDSCMWHVAVYLFQFVSFIIHNFEICSHKQAYEMSWLCGCRHVAKLPTNRILLQTPHRAHISPRAITHIHYTFTDVDAGQKKMNEWKV